jgi:hypothetical protein
VSGLYGRSATDAFPTTYQANTGDQFRRLAQAHGNLHLANLHAIPDPSYLAFHPLLFRLMCHIEERLPTSASSTWSAFAEGSRWQVQVTCHLQHATCHLQLAF